MTALAAGPAEVGVPWEALALGLAWWLLEECHWCGCWRGDPGGGALRHGPARLLLQEVAPGLAKRTCFLRK